MIEPFNSTLVGLVFSRCFNLLHEPVSPIREKRLWLGALAVTAAIYATLGFAGEMVGFLQEQGLLEIGFIAGLGLAALATFSQWLLRHPSAREVWGILGLVAVVGMVGSRVMGKGKTPA